MSEIEQQSKDKADPVVSTGSVSPYKAGFSCKCPACGDAPLFNGLLDIHETCENCGFDMSAADPGDGPAVFVILVLGAITTIAAIIVAVNFQLPPWAHAIIWTLFISAGGIYLLRVFKALLIALQFHHDAKPGEQDMDGK